MTHKISTRIKHRRLALNLTQKELAAQLHVSDKTISKWETGRGIPDIGNLVPLATLLDIPLDVLLDTGSDGETMKTATPAVPLDYAIASQAQQNHNWSRFVDGIVSLIAFLGISICLIVDLSLNRSLTWSLIPFVAIVLAWGLYTVIRQSKKQALRNSLIYLSLVCIPFVYCLEVITQGTWFKDTGFAMCLFGITFAWLGYAILRSKLSDVNRVVAITALVIATQFALNFFLSTRGQRPMFMLVDIISLLGIVTTAAVILIIISLVKPKQTKS